MSEKFESLGAEKRGRVLFAALSEFARRGYDEASTNSIATEADIAKGSVFAYFKSKKALYLYLVRWAMEIISDEMYAKIDFTELELFARMEQIRSLKLSIFSKYPHLSEFLLSMASEDSKAVADESRSIWFEPIHKAINALFEGLDESFFRTDIPVKEIYKLINAIVEDYERKVHAVVKAQGMSAERIAAWDAQWTELVGYMKKLFYREGLRI